jgi:hypothetical protein
LFDRRIALCDGGQDCLARTGAASCSGLGKLGDMNQRVTGNSDPAKHPRAPPGRPA